MCCGSRFICSLGLTLCFCCLDPCCCSKSGSELQIEVKPGEPWFVLFHSLSPRLFQTLHFMAFVSETWGWSLVRVAVYNSGIIHLKCEPIKMCCWVYFCDRTWRSFHFITTWKHPETMLQQSNVLFLQFVWIFLYFLNMCKHNFTFRLNIKVYRWHINTFQIWKCIIHQI